MFAFELAKNNVPGMAIRSHDRLSKSRTFLEFLSTENFVVEKMFLTSKIDHVAEFRSLGRYFCKRFSKKWVI